MTNALGSHLYNSRGLDLAAELAIPNACPVVCIEREAFAVAHLVDAMEKGWLAPAPVWSDARTFDGRRWRGHVDAVIGGIPCQPHSVAGYEPESAPLWLWEEAILQGYEAFRYLRQHRRGRLHIDAGQRRLSIEALP